jgi:lipopolysaccharide transport system ATP-binding protein
MNGSEPIVEIEDVSKAYQLYERPSDLLKESLLGGIRHDLFWALRDLSFTLYEGQRVGIIGPNGAGKSTLLKIITGNLQPTAGKVTVHGRVSALLSMVPAWNAMESGIENIRFNLFLQGCNRARIPQLVEEIVDFTELGPFIYQPVKTYSTGMSARLGFGIATAIEPDILIIDEILGTGDAYFAGKAQERIRSLCERGRGLLFVSHAASAVQKLCDRAIWLQNGSVRMQGEAGYVLRQYELDHRRVEDEQLRAGNRKQGLAKTGVVTSEALGDGSRVVFRLMPVEGAYFSDTHFVESIEAELLDEAPIRIPLELPVDRIDDLGPRLEVLTSEWGRIHEHRGRQGRILAHNSGHEPGGQFSLPRPAGMRPGEAGQISIVLTSMALMGREELKVEVIDTERCEWVELSRVRSSVASNGWGTAVFTGTVSCPPVETVRNRRIELQERERPPVELQDSWIAAPEGRIAVVREHEPFLIGLKLLFREQLPLVDVSIKIERSDGVYAFWMSSGMVDRNLVNPYGERRVEFVFDPNVFGAGSYHVNATVSNGWNYPDNYPHSMLYLREIAVVRFKVLPALNGLDLGIVNQRVGVLIDGAD